MKIYTKTGDKGTTSLIGGERVSKNSPKVISYGTVDELMAFLGHLHDKLMPYPEQNSTREQLTTILRTLMDLAEILATSDSSPYPKKQISEQSITQMEQWIDSHNEQLAPLTDFTLPCGHELVSFAHICRTISRRAEREILAAEIDDINAQTYVNRLSDYLYILGRKLCNDFKVKETLRNV